MNTMVTTTFACTLFIVCKRAVVAIVNAVAAVSGNSSELGGQNISLTPTWTLRGGAAWLSRPKPPALRLRL